MFALLKMRKAISLHHTTDPFLMSMLVGSSLRRKMTLKNNNLDWSTRAQITENMLNQSVPLCTSSDLWLFCLESSIIL